MRKTAYIAFDLGATSGRAMLATLDRGRVKLDELHRFRNVPRQLPSGLHWDLLGLWGNVLEGLARGTRVAQKRGLKLVSLGVDTWGVDMALLGRSGQLLGLPMAYRDPSHPRAMRRALRRVSSRDIYRATGIQMLPFNTIYQLLARRHEEPDLLSRTHRLLMLPDLLHYFFTGHAVNEATIASTTQLIDPRPRARPRRGTYHGRWHKPLARRLGIPTAMLGPIVPAGTKIGLLRRAIADELDIPRIAVIAPGSHDTASAVAAVPVMESHAVGGGASAESWAYLSSGTWSILGVELDRPLINDASRRAGFANERGVGGKILFLKNLAGMWLVEECRRDWSRRGRNFEHTELSRLAASAAPFRTLIDPNHADFIAPGSMPARIAALAARTGQPIPRLPGQFVRCCLESLALAYRRGLLDLEALLERPLAVLHVVGGGGRNGLLNQMAADAAGRRVVVGPYEAAAIGNALTQAIGAGQVRDLSHLRRIVAASYKPKTYLPRPRMAAAFAAQVRRFDDLHAG